MKENKCKCISNATQETTFKFSSTLNVAFSIEYIIKHNIPINDAIHLYAALTRKTSIDEFIWSDKNLKQTAEREGFKILEPEE